MVVFNQDGKSVSPFVPVDFDKVRHVFGEMPKGYLQIDAEALEDTGQFENPDMGVQTNNTSFVVKKPIDIQDIKDRISLGSVWIELPSALTLKYISQNRGFSYLDHSFIRLKFANPDRHLEVIAEHLQNQGFNLSAKDNNLMISVPNFLSYRSLCELADKIYDWLLDHGLSTFKSTIAVYGMEFGSGTISYLHLEPLPENRTFTEAYILEQQEDDDSNNNGTGSSSQNSPI